MGDLTDYQYSHERIGIPELDVATVLLQDASKVLRLTVRYVDRNVSPSLVADLAKVAIIEQQLAEALQEGRLVILPRDPATREGQKDA